MIALSEPYSVAVGTRIRDGKPYPRYARFIRVACECGYEYTMSLLDLSRAKPGLVCRSCYHARLKRAPRNELGRFVGGSP